MKPAKYLLALGLATALTGCVVPAEDYYTQRHYTSPTYTLVENAGDIEVRNYSSFLVAEITESGDHQTALKNGYDALNDYFLGDNSTGEAIAMTRPVVEFPAFRNNRGYVSNPTVANNKWVIRFFLPVEYARAAVPQPADPNIRILETHPMNVIAVRFSGPWTDANLQDNENLLRTYASNNGFQTLDVPAYAFYDSPAMAPWSRHNEIMMKLAD